MGPVLIDFGTGPFSLIKDHCSCFRRDDNIIDYSRVSGEMNNGCPDWSEPVGGRSFSLTQGWLVAILEVGQRRLFRSFWTDNGRLQGRRPDQIQRNSSGRACGGPLDG
jgi:hypothetical protein